MKEGTSHQDFNSTMVRLKVYSEKGLRGRLQFQFHYGTIKRMYQKVVLMDQSNFNSTMVRLKDVAFILWSVTIKFQFHYGTIKSGKQSV